MSVTNRLAEQIVEAGRRVLGFDRPAWDVMSNRERQAAFAGINTAQQVQFSREIAGLFQ